MEALETIQLRWARVQKRYEAVRGLSKTVDEYFRELEFRYETVGMEVKIAGNVQDVAIQAQALSKEADEADADDFADECYRLHTALHAYAKTLETYPS